MDSTNDVDLRKMVSTQDVDLRNMYQDITTSSTVSMVKEECKTDLTTLSRNLTNAIHRELYFIPFSSGQDDSPMVILENINCILQADPNLANGHLHNLCTSLVINYVNQVERLEMLKESSTASDEFEQIMNSLVTTRKIMNILANSQNSTNQQILTRTFMDCILSWNKELEDEKKMKEKPVVEVSLHEENVKYGGPQASFKFKKIPLNPSKDFISWKNRTNQEPLLSRNFSRLLIMEGVKSCVRDYNKFSNLLVEVITPDVMFNDAIWPDEEFLKVTIERDLLISKKYEDHPVLWDLTELVAVNRFLRNCCPLVRALMAVNMASWASGVSSEIQGSHALESTQKLLSLLSKAEFIPSTPFKFVPDLLHKLSPWDIYCILSDVYKLIRESFLDPTAKIPLRPYLERLRIILSHKCPGPTFVKIFKGII